MRDRPVGRRSHPPGTAVHHSPCRTRDSPRARTSRRAAHSTGNGPQVMATLRNFAIGDVENGHTTIAAACRYHARDATRTPGLSPA